VFGKRHYGFGIVSDIGDRRAVNQDSVLVKSLELGKKRYGLAAVADGMGGHLRGEVASKAVPDRLSRWWDDEFIRRVRYNTRMDDALAQAEEALTGVNTELFNKGKALGGLIGTTLSMLICGGGEYFILHVGDSRVYRVHGKRLSLLTEDHISGRYVTRAVGVAESPRFFRARGRFKPGRMFMLCSDGLYKHLSQADMIKCLSDRSHRNLQEKAGALRAKIPKGSASDNVSVILYS
jgi:protein phosphatase